MYVLKAIWVLTVCAPIKSGSTPEQKNKLKKKRGGYLKITIISYWDEGVNIQPH